MKNIFVPTDFSGTAETAFNYAISLAQKLNSKLILFHAYQVAVPVAEIPFGVLNDERKFLKEESDKKLKALSAKINLAGNIAYECISGEGDITESILKAAKEKKADLIVMGTTGETGLSGIIFGSVSLKIMEKAHCPVMTVPPGFSISKEIKKITYATDYHRSDITAIEKAAEIAGATHAQLNILHISDAGMDAEEELQLINDFKEKVLKKTKYTHLSFQVIHGVNIEERLEEYVEDGGTDMLLMATHYRTFLDKLFGKSITKNVVRDTIVPAVAFHFNAKTAVKLY